MPLQSELQIFASSSKLEPQLTIKKKQRSSNNNSDIGSAVDSDLSENSHTSQKSVSSTQSRNNRRRRNRGERKNTTAEKDIVNSNQIENIQESSVTVNNKVEQLNKKNKINSYPENNDEEGIKLKNQTRRDSSTTNKDKVRSNNQPSKKVNKSIIQPKDLKARMESFSKFAKYTDLPTESNSESSSKDLKVVEEDSKDSSRSKRNGNKFKSKLNNKDPPNKYSNGEDQNIRTKLIRSLSSARYECMCCLETIKHRSATWSCKNCWAVFHLQCTTKWIKTLEKERQDTGLSPWRCPGCQAPQEISPKSYKCFCEKVVKPELNRGHTPHSCGMLCGRSRGVDCPHACVELCHPGPCPPCTSLAPEASCFCGKVKYQTRCSDPEAFGKSCNAPCDKPLDCGKHICANPCHEGPCLPCQALEEKPCYCGASTKDMKCEAGISKISYNSDIKKYFDGYYSCDMPCEKKLSCGNHNCEKVCHPMYEKPGRCNKDPAYLKKCPCGKTDIAFLLDEPRTTCLDPIPVCDKTCDKELGPCGHKCSVLCHEGECPPCSQTVIKFCDCGSTSVSGICSELDSPPPCQKPCNQYKHCLKHKCTELCCKASAKSSDDSAGLHICRTVCGKRLKCGAHVCQIFCHNGKCPPCLNASFDDLTCNCGGTKVLAPVPCGTKPPSCKLPCTRLRECGHSAFFQHPCHFDNEKCPPCTTLTTKTCLCGKKEIKHIPCYRQTPSCGTPCNKPLECGGHLCKRVCHDGPCFPENTSCQSLCGKPRPQCNHPCQSNCHAPSLCPSDVPCKSSATFTCPCGLLKLEKPCNGTPLEEQGIECDEKCLLELRNRRLAEAFGIAESKGPVLGSNLKYDPYVFVFVVPSQFNWVRSLEIKIVEFIQDPTRKSLRFSPMRSSQRKFLHCIAENFGVRTQSLDVPPNMSVEYTKTQLTNIPKVLPSEAYRYPDKYMALEDSEEFILNGLEPKTPQQAINMVLVRGISLKDAMVASIFQRLVTDHELQADLFDYGLNVVFKPNPPASTDMDKQEELVRRCAYLAKTALATARIVFRINLGYVNNKQEVLYPKLDPSPRVIVGNAPISSSNPFAALQLMESSSPFHPSHITRELVIKPRSRSSSNASSSRNLSPPKMKNITDEHYQAKSILLNVNPVDDWMELA